MRLGGGVAYVAMPKAGSKTVEKTLARSNVSAPAANFAAFHRATLSPTPPFVFTFVRSPASHYASGLGQAQMHFYGPARECYAYGHKCMQGTPPYQIARKNRLKAEAEGTAVAPRRVSKWLSAATYESGGGGKPVGEASSLDDVTRELERFMAGDDDEAANGDQNSCRTS